MKRSTIAALLLAVCIPMVSQLASAELYFRLGVMTNPNEFRGTGKDPVLSNPLATIGGRWNITEFRKHQHLNFYIEHSSGLASGEHLMGLNQLGVELIFTD